MKHTPTHVRLRTIDDLKRKRKECPVCYSRVITSSGLMLTWKKSKQFVENVACKDCASSWTDVYRLEEGIMTNGVLVLVRYKNLVALGAKEKSDRKPK